MTDEHGLSIYATDHAIEKWRKYTGSSDSALAIMHYLSRMYERGEEVKLKKKYQVQQIIEHGFTKAHYYRSDGFILVVNHDKTAIITVHDGKAGRWE